MVVHQDARSFAALQRRKSIIGGKAVQYFSIALPVDDKRFRKHSRTTSSFLNASFQQSPHYLHSPSHDLSIKANFTYHYQSDDWFSCDEGHAAVDAKSKWSTPTWLILFP